jgi:hypothetical protein
MLHARPRCRGVDLMVGEPGYAKRCASRYTKVAGGGWFFDRRCAVVVGSFDRRCAVVVVGSLIGGVPWWLVLLIGAAPWWWFSLEEAASVMVAIVWWPALDVRGVSVLCLLREGAEIFVCCLEMCVVYAHWRVRGDTC